MSMIPASENADILRCENTTKPLQNLNRISVAAHIGFDVFERPAQE